MDSSTGSMSESGGLRNNQDNEPFYAARDLDRSPALLLVATCSESHRSAGPPIGIMAQHVLALRRALTEFETCLTEIEESTNAATAEAAPRQQSGGPGQSGSGFG
jgi:hypothetical protein